MTALNSAIDPLPGERTSRTRVYRCGRRSTFSTLQSWRIRAVWRIRCRTVPLPAQRKGAGDAQPRPVVPRGEQARTARTAARSRNAPALGLGTVEVMRRLTADPGERTDAEGDGDAPRDG